jgi:hypothetical protein
MSHACEGRAIYFLGDVSILFVARTYKRISHSPSSKAIKSQEVPLPPPSSTTSIVYLTISAEVLLN